MCIKDKIAVIIPSLDPDDKLLFLLNNLKDKQFKNIIIVNDGSGEEYEGFYKDAMNKYGCKVLRHYVNWGKGRALKSAFNYILTERPDIEVAVTADSDGQHKAEDIWSCCEASLNEWNCMVLGVRDFYGKGENIPARSRWGNVITSKVLKLLCGIEISDTQTGLRAFSRTLMENFLTVQGERFEYEMNMILDVKEHEIPIKEIPIQTVYIENNKSSHFNPIKDSLKIYALFSKFIVSSLLSSVIDVGLFSLFVSIMKGTYIHYIIIATCLARFVSSLINYQINRTKVFKSLEKRSSTMIKYYILCVIQMFISAYLTKWLFNSSGINLTFIKIIVDVLLFFISFKIQKEVIFSKKRT